MDDAPDESELLRRFEDATWPLEQWDHRAHLTVAWHYLVEHGLEGAIERMRAGVQKYNAAQAVPDERLSGYHETLTVAWCHVMYGVMRAHGTCASGAEFLKAQPFLLNKLLLRLYYSRPRIMSWDAKRGFLEPDLAPFPAP